MRNDRDFGGVNPISAAGSSATNAKTAISRSTFLTMKSAYK